jgi:hypothetical protein
MGDPTGKENHTVDHDKRADDPRCQRDKNPGKDRMLVKGEVEGF